jgi:hypothetical protein
MSNILLVEPEYRSKFPPLGLLRLSTYHKRRHDHVTFVRGRNHDMRRVHWDRVYVASLFTWELPRTLETIRFYTPCVADPKNVIVGGVGATLLPAFIRQRAQCTVVEGPLDRPGLLSPQSPPISDEIPDYSILEGVDYDYRPVDAYFARITKGCIRKCSFCAVPLLEREFGFVTPLADQIRRAKRAHGEKQNLVILDNNILAIRGISRALNEIAALGFTAGARRNNRKRTVDFNQGIDARLITAKPELAKDLAKLSLDPVRLAFDFIGMQKSYEEAIRLMADVSFVEFTNYMLFNFNDSPADLFERMWINATLNAELGIRITGFPMRFIPMDDVSRRHVAPKWKWRFLRGIQCVLLATKGLVSPNAQRAGAKSGATGSRI